MRHLLERFQDWLLRKGIDGEIKSAKLTEDSVRLSFGEVIYLRRIHDSAPVKEAVLMLHGAAADKTSWIRLCKYLKSDLPLLVPDLPGHGKSTSDLSLAYNIDAQVQRMKEMLSVLHIKRVHIIANSMGGAIALRLAAHYPELVSSLVLIGIVGIQAKESWLQEHIRKSGRNPMIEVSTKEDYLAMMRIGMEKPPYMPGFLFGALSRNYISRLAINKKISGDIELDLDQSSELSSILCPVLAIWGSEDKVSHITNAKQLCRQLASSRLELLEGIGHVPMVEAPKQVAAICTTFLAANHSRKVH
jgi:abhydrolase domain-containing protein 6